MFKPNVDCVVHSASGKTDVYGKPILGKSYKEKCAVIKLNVRNMKSAVRADSSASRGTAHEFETDAILILTKATKAVMDDVVVVMGHKLKLTGVFPMNDINGDLDHYRVEGTTWSDVV